MASAVSHPVFARAFPAMSRALEAGGMARHRKDLLAALSALRSLAIGVGSGAIATGSGCRSRCRTAKLLLPVAAGLPALDLRAVVEVPRDWRRQQPRAGPRGRAWRRG